MAALAIILAGVLGGVVPVPHAPSAPQILPQTQTQTQTQTQMQGQIQPNAARPPIQAQFADQSNSMAGVTTHQATLESTSGGTAKVRFANGATQTYNLSTGESAALRPSIGKAIAFRVVKGTMQVAKNTEWATLQAVRNGVATLRDKAGKLTNYTVNAATAAQLQGMVGQPIAFTLNGNMMLFASDQAP
ncbi:MAG TPA: hypothetical protein VMF11_03430 [Candidatus Baltobacteraceae bacterium]|nr:hypothetical protein [Candidatus Baltobacteraceae bacterium]